MKMKRRLLVRALLNRKGRLAVSLVTAFLGTVLIFTLLNLNYDIPNQFSNAFQTYGANVIFVPKNQQKAVTATDLSRLQTLLSQQEINGLAAYHYETVTLNQQPVQVALSDLGAVAVINPAWLVTGRWPSAPHEILLGKDIAEQSQLKVGDVIKLQTLLDKTQATSRLKTDNFTVSGVLTTGGGEEQQAFMLPAGGSQLFGTDLTIDLIEGSLVGTKAELTALVATLNAQLPVVTGYVASRVSEAQDQILAKISRLFLVIVVFVVILVGLILGSTTFALLADRRKEISLKKALGAGEAELRQEFLRENALVTSLGYLTGLLAGVGVTKWVSVRIFLRESALYWPVFLLTGVMLASVMLLATLLPLRSLKQITIEQILKGD